VCSSEGLADVLRNLGVIVGVPVWFEIWRVRGRRYKAVW
jgi:hypothetical protein